MLMSKSALDLLNNCYQKYQETGKREFSYTPGNSEQLSNFLNASNELIHRLCIRPISDNFDNDSFELSPNLDVIFDFQLTEIGIQLASESID